MKVPNLNVRPTTTAIWRTIRVVVMTLFLLGTIRAKAQNVNIPDANFKSELLAYTSINTNNDSEIQVSEAQAYSGTIDVSYADISDLSGIEAFVNITKLRCNGNQLTSLDVSENIALTELQCHSNQLTSLDISDNTALTTFYCSANQITSLDVSANTKLTSLIALSNKLTVLDVSNNTALISLNCTSNKLTRLDVSNNAVLRYLSCANNELTSLNVIANLELVSLSCYNNPLTTLTFGNNGDLARLYCYETELTSMDLSQLSGLELAEVNKNLLTSLKLNKEIKDLDCSNNQLTSLDLSQNLSLDYLTCSYNQLTTLDASVNAALATLLCDNNQLTSLTLNPELTALNCFDNQLTTLDLSGNPAMYYLNCRNNPISNLDLSNNEELISLDTQGCQLTSLDVSKNPKLTYLICGNNNLTHIDVSKNTALAYFNCEYNQLTSIDLRLHSALTTVYCNNNQLTHLDLRNDNNSTIRYLRAYQNELTCVVVDDVSDSHSGWQKDAVTTYCSGPSATVVISTPHGSATNQSPFPITVTFDDQVTGFELSDLAVTNGTMDNLQTSDNKTYTFDCTPLASGAITINMDDHQVENQLGDPNRPAVEFSVIYETVAPTAMIQSEEEGETKLSSIPLTITFSEEVVGFELADVHVFNGTLENLQTIDNQTFTLDLIPAQQGDTQVDLPEAATEDLAGNFNTAAENFSIFYDAVPSVVITASESGLTNKSSLELQVTFTEEVDGFELTDLIIDNGVVAHLKTSDNKVYQMDLTSYSAGMVSVGFSADQVTDETGNGNDSAEDWVIMYDNVPPTAVITSSQGSKTTASSFPVTITFNEKITGFELTDISLVNSTAANLESSDDKTFTFDLTPASEGNVTVDVAANKATDQAGNGNTAAAQWGITYEVILGLEDLHERISLHPNPTANQLFIQMDERANSRISQAYISLTDIRGKQVINEQLLSKQDGAFSINLSSCPSGIYVLQVITDSGSSTKKVIKK